MILVRPEALGIQDLSTYPADAGADPKDPDLLLRYLKAGNARAVRGFVLSGYLAGDSVAEICDGPILSAMEELGRAWRTQSDGIFLEHRATDLCLQALDQLRGLAEIPEDAPVILGGAPARDPYILPSVMAATSLVMVGVDAVNLGPDTPAASLISAAEHYDVSTVWLSMTSSIPSPFELESYLDELIRGYPRPLTVVVGGRASQPLRDVERPGLHHLDSMADLVTFARDRFDLPDPR
jgi:methanogenic corrinoid protein MtbC1